MPTFAEMHTPGDHQCGEVASAMQKAIRRGDERSAMYWATELDLAGYTGYVWKRLRIIASEDVGLADSNVFVQVWTLNQAWLELKKASSNDKAQSRRLHLLHAVAILARAPKSRMLDHAFMVFYEGERPRIEVPDHALDKHTARGRKLGRGEDHFFEEAALLENEGDVDDPYADEGRAARSAPIKRD